MAHISRTVPLGKAEAVAKKSIAESDCGTVRMSGRASCDCGHRFQAPDVEVGPDFIRIVCPGCHHDILDIRS